MYKILTKKRTLATFALMLLAWMFISRCFPGTEKWREEVELSDGRIIEIERVLLRQGGGDEIIYNWSGSRPKEHRLKFTHPNNPQTIIEWRGGKIDVWKSPEIPLILDIESGNPVIYTRVGVGDGSKIMYSKYVFQQGSWQGIELPDTFAEMNSNLFFATQSGMSSYISLRTKRTEYKSIYSPKTLKKVGPKRITFT